MNGYGYRGKLVRLQCFTYPNPVRINIMEDSNEMGIIVVAACCFWFLDVLGAAEHLNEFAEARIG